MERQYPRNVRPLRVVQAPRKKPLTPLQFWTAFGALLTTLGGGTLILSYRAGALIERLDDISAAVHRLEIKVGKLEIDVARIEERVVQPSHQASQSPLR